jgi:hypothetical protein
MAAIAAAATPSLRGTVPDDPIPGAAQQAAARGTLLAVCGVWSGAGTSTIAYLIALAAARSGSGRVLLCRTHEPLIMNTDGDEDRRRSRLALAGSAAAGLFIHPPDETRRDALQVVHANTAALAEHPARVGRRLARARATHALTVVDCGTLRRPIERIALAHATHLGWVIPATADGLAHARRATRAARLPTGGRELLIARGEPTSDPPPLPGLRSLAGERLAPLILLPWLSARTLQRDAAALDAAAVGLQAILGAFER